MGLAGNKPFPEHWEERNGQFGLAGVGSRKELSKMCAIFWNILYIQATVDGQQQSGLYAGVI